MRKFPMDIMSRILVILAIVFGVTACGSETGVTAGEYLSRAKVYQEKGELRAALIELRNAVQKSPDNSEARWQLGDLVLQFGNGPTAEKEIRRAIALGFSIESASVSLTQALLIQGKYQKALDVRRDLDRSPGTEFRTSDTYAELRALWGHANLKLYDIEVANRMYDLALGQNPDSPEAGIGKARMAGASGDIAETRRWLAKVRKATPDFAPAWSLLGAVERSEGNGEKAEEAYSRAIEASPFNNFADLVARALVRIFLENYDGAASDIESARERAPKHPIVAYAQGLLHLAKDELEEARSAFRESLTSAPDYMPAIFYMGVVNYRLGQIEQAGQNLAKVLAADPGFDEAARLLVIVRLQTGDYQAAESLLKPMLARRPDDVVVLTLLQKVAFPQGKSDEGIAYLQRLTALRPDSSKAYLSLGLGLLSTGKREQGLDALETASNLEPQQQDAAYALIVNHIAAGEAEQALAAAERMRIANPNSPRPLTLMGQAYALKDEDEAARGAFVQALALSPGDVHASLSLAALESKQGNAEAARDLYERVTRDNPGNLPALMALVAMELRDRQVDKAVMLLQQAIRTNPEALQPRLLLARYALRTNQPERALTVLREVAQTYPNDLELLTYLGNAHLAAGRPAQATELFERLVTLAPDSAQARFLLATAFAKTRNVGAARKNLETALSLDPRHLASKLAMSRLSMLEGDPEAANKMLGELKDENPDHPEVLALEGWLAMSQGRPGDAVTAYAKAFGRRPGRELLLGLARAQLRAGQSRAATASLEAWLDKNPSDERVRLALGDAYSSLGNVEGAKSAYLKVLEASPNNVQALNNLAELLMDADPGTALKYAETAYKLAPNAWPVIDTYGTVLLRNEKYGQSARILREASGIVPANLSIQYRLALALARNGQKKEAREVLGKVLVDESSFAQKDDARALMQELEGS